MARKLTAWLSIGSTYSYLTAMRIKKLSRRRYQSFDYSYKHQTNNEKYGQYSVSPSKKTKVNYMWRDIERRASLYKVPVPKVPAPYPLKEFDRANLVGIVMNDKGLYLDYFKFTYEEWFLNGNEAGSKQNLEVTLKKLGLDLQETIALADTMEERYIENTKQALDFGIFGVPSFSFSNEIFWGDDRLEDAIRLAPQK